MIKQDDPKLRKLQMLERQSNDSLRVEVLRLCCILFGMDSDQVVCILSDGQELMQHEQKLRQDIQILEDAGYKDTAACNNLKESLDRIKQQRDGYSGFLGINDAHMHRMVLAGYAELDRLPAVSDSSNRIVWRYRHDYGTQS